MQRKQTVAPTCANNLIALKIITDKIRTRLPFRQQPGKEINRLLLAPSVRLTDLALCAMVVYVMIKITLIMNNQITPHLTRSPKRRRALVCNC